MATQLVRLKPFNAKRGHLLRKYTHGPSGKKFEEALGWYKVDAALAKYLETVPQQQGDPDSPNAFDVCTEAEAKAIDAREKKEKARKDPGEANDLSTRDLRSRGDQLEGEETSPAAERRRGRAAPARGRAARSVS